MVEEPKKKVVKKKISGSCETCEYYDYDEDMEEYVCIINLDEDDLYRLKQNAKFTCPYYKFYDEYKSVQKQN